VSSVEGLSRWQVSVDDEEAAEAQLLRLVLSDDHLIVTEFGRKKYELEEIFMGLIEGDEDGGN
jgi:ABC-2 type transport system ATP-binding protein